MASSFFSGVLKRLFFFQFMFIFAYYKYRDLTKSSHEFKDKINQVTSQLNFTHPLLDTYLKNPLFTFQMFLGVNALFALLAILGSKFASLLAGVMLMVTNLLYFRPVKDFNDLSLKNVVAQSPFEFLLLSVLSVGMIAYAFKPSEKCCAVAKVEESTIPKREAKPSSSKQKKRID